MFKARLTPVVLLCCCTDRSIGRTFRLIGVASGGDWLSVAAAGGNGGNGAGEKSPMKRRKSSVAPGGWMSVKLGLSAGDEDDQDKPGEVVQNIWCFTEHSSLE